MVDRRTSTDSGGLRDTVERYSPDGAGGRLLLALVTGTGSLFALWFAALAFVEPLFLGLFALLFGTLFVASGAVTLLVLWPVYLSLIGELESAADYGEGSETSGADEADPVAVLKREYAAGNVSESEFETRLERLLGVEAVEEARPEASDPPGAGERGAGGQGTEEPEAAEELQDLER